MENANFWRGDNATTPLNPPDIFVAKDSITIHILGSLQELSSTLGLARSFLGIAGLKDIDAMLREVQRHLYVIKADLASQSEEEIVAGKKIPRIEDSLVQTVDGFVAEMEKRLGIKPDRFIIETGDPAAAATFLSNEVARRSERLIVSLRNANPQMDSVFAGKLDKAQQYLNHLSYQLYLTARVINRTLGIEEETIMTDAATGTVIASYPGK